MEKWAIRPDPSPFDPRRHVLLVKGDMKDISAILRKFGALCGRPSPTKTPEGYNFSLTLHAMTQAGIERLSASLNEMSGAMIPPATVAFPSGGQTAPPPMTIAPAIPPPLEPPTISPSAPAAEPARISNEPAPSPFVLPPAAGLPEPPVDKAALPAAPSHINAAPDIPPLAPAPVPMAQEPLSLNDPLAFTGGAPVVPPASGLSEPPMDKAALPADPSQLKSGPDIPPAVAPPPQPVSPPGLTSLAPSDPLAAPFSPAGFMPPPAPATPAPAPALESAPEAPVPGLGAPPTGNTPPPVALGVGAPGSMLAPPAAAPGGGGTSFAPQPRTEKPVWGLTIAFDPDCTFDTMLVGPYNRFAHAAATSVVGSPGSMYNPLFLYGAAGVGKSHAAHAIAQGLAATLTRDGVVMTSGARLARAVSAALAESRFGELEQYLAARKALIVDDIHLLAVTEANRQPLARVFELFFSKSSQVVLTSIYPPRALGALEEALKISLGKGWSVDLKVPATAVQIELLQGYFDKNGVATNVDTIKLFHERMVGNHGEWKRWAVRLKNLSVVMSAGGASPGTHELVTTLFDPGTAAGAAEFPTQEELEAAKSFALPPAGGDALNLAVFLPKGQEHMGAWVVSRFYEAGKQFQVPLTYRQVLQESYDAGQPFGVPFQIGDLCLRSGAQAALIVGPPADSGLASRVGEFSHAVRHILEGLDAATGWVPHNGTTSPYHFLRAHLDFMPPSS